MTDRQEQLLAAIIKEFIETATAVGSVSLTDKYRFNLSPATVRNEMAELVRQGYLAKPHSSAGRVPTTQGLRHFLQELLDELDEVDVVTKEQVKHQLHQTRFEQDKLVREALAFLTEISGNAAVAVIDQRVHYAGLSAIMNLPEFQDIDKLKKLMEVIEDYSKLTEMFNRSQGRDVSVLIGEEAEIEGFEEYAIVFARIRLHGRKEGYMAVVGPNGMHYQKIIPAVKFVSRAITDLVKAW